MPLFVEVGPEAKQRLQQMTKGDQSRRVYRDMVAQLEAGKHVEVQPDEGESLRKIKVNVRRAGNELGVNVTYGETQEGTLLVWSEAPAIRPGRRGRPKKVSA